MVYVTAVMNYAAQSEMLIYLLRSVRGLVEQKAYTEMDGAVKVRESVCVCVCIVNVWSYRLVLRKKFKNCQPLQESNQRLKFCVFFLQDIMEVRNYLRVLNGKTATATALILYNLASAGILGESSSSLYTHSLATHSLRPITLSLSLPVQPS